MLEWLKRHAWKACIRQKRIGGSNPPYSAKAVATESQRLFLLGVTDFYTFDCRAQIFCTFLHKIALSIQTFFVPLTSVNIIAINNHVNRGTVNFMLLLHLLMSFIAELFENQ